MNAVDRAGREHVAGNTNAVGATCLHGAAVAVAVDCQRYRVADRHIAANRAGDGNRAAAGRFRAIDRADRIDRDTDGFRRGDQGVGLVGAGRRGVARSIGCRDAGMHTIDGSGGQHVAGYADAVGAASLHGSRVTMAADGQRDRIAGRHIAADGTGNGDRRGTRGFRAVDRGDWIDGDADLRRGQFDVVTLVGIGG